MKDQNWKDKMVRWLGWIVAIATWVVELLKNGLPS